MKNSFLIILLFVVAFAICQEYETDDEATASMTSTGIEAEITATSTISTATSIEADITATSTILTITSTATSDETAQPTSIESEIPTVNKTVNPIVCQNLQQLYKSLNGNAWIVRTGWDSTDMSTCCSWYNVHCNTIGHVLKM